MVTVCGAGHWIGGTPPEQTYETVTLVLFQPLAFGAGDSMGETASGETTVNVAELLVPAPGTEITTGIAPSATPLGTETTMLVLLQLVGVAEIPPKVTVLVPCVVPNPVPAIVTDVPIGPDAGVKLLIVGATATGLTSTKLRLKASAVGAVSLIVTAVPVAEISVGTCCTHNVHVWPDTVHCS